MGHDIAGKHDLIYNLNGFGEPDSAWNCAIAWGVGGNMDSDLKDDRNRSGDPAFVRDSSVSPYVALDRLLRYAHTEALNQNRAIAASLIEAAIISLPDISDVSKH
jgi:hypothetical protein